MDWQLKEVVEFADKYHPGLPEYALIGSDIPGLTINTDGSWSFDPANVAYDDLAKDELKTISVSYSVTDDRGAVDTGTFSINLTGTNTPRSDVHDRSFRVGRSERCIGQCAVAEWSAECN